ncbi:D-threo-aldose 1-dehydrogenase [Mycetocola sp. CAN_C7]|uniref:aldo/keto reductase n=1 Tax=Mycetocola sp. CAN_C7 TaxID=2787724 RepID=UPI0018CA3B65
MTSPDTSRPLGAGGPLVSRLCLGTSSWSHARVGNGPVPALEEVLGIPAGAPGRISFLDTSNEYGGGNSEVVIGTALAGRPGDIVLQTKLDRDPVTGDFGGERMRRSLAESLDRLGIASIPLLYLHDPELISYDEALAVDGPVAALVAMKESGVAERIGISGGPAPMLRHYVGTGLFDAVITHNRLTLVDRSSAELVAEASGRGMAVLNAAVFGGGALANWPQPATRYAYGQAHPATTDAVRLMGEACARSGVPLAAAAIQFSSRHPDVTSTVIGATSSAHIRDAIAADLLDIPASLWEELETLVPPSSAWKEPPTSTWPPAS